MSTTTTSRGRRSAARPTAGNPVPGTGGAGTASAPAPGPVEVVLFDRDGTLILDVPYNGDPAAVRPVPGAAEALARLRRAGVAVGMVTNQSGLARGDFDRHDLARVQARVAELLGPFAVVEHCPHGPGDGCRCRKPAPGMVLSALARLGVCPGACVMVGDTAADVEAAEAAGAVGILVPNQVTLPEEVVAARHTAADLAEAVARFVLPRLRPRDADAAAHPPPPPAPAPSPARDRRPGSGPGSGPGPGRGRGPGPGPGRGRGRGRGREGDSDSDSDGDGRRDPGAVSGGGHRPGDHRPGHHEARPGNSGPGGPGGGYERPRPVLVARLDSAGDVVLAGPAIRAVARTHPVVLAVSSRGRAAAECLPGVDAVIELDAGWVLAEAPPVDSRALARFGAAVAAHRPRAAAILTSSHQSPLPLALLLRLARVPEIAAVSLDHPGSLLDHRIPGDPDLHEVARALAVVERLGYRPAEGDDGLAVEAAELGARLPPRPYVVVHPGAAAGARTLSPPRWRSVVSALAEAGHRVVVTGSRDEEALTAAVAAGAPSALDRGGAYTLAELAGALEGASALVTGNTCPMHLAAAVGTPVAAVFPPTVPAERWRPWRVPHVLLGDQGIGCRGCRARTCPVPGQPCLAPVTPDAVVGAVADLVPARQRPPVVA